MINVLWARVQFGHRSMITSFLFWHAVRAWSSVMAKSCCTKYMRATTVLSARKDHILTNNKNNHNNNPHPSCCPPVAASSAYPKTSLASLDTSAIMSSSRMPTSCEKHKQRQKTNTTKRPRTARLETFQWVSNRNEGNGQQSMKPIISPLTLFSVFSVLL